MPRVIGIVNVTPDSFSDGGRFTTSDAVVAHARRLVSEGAHWLDVGGESTRPGAAPVSPEEEASRVLPAIKAITAALDVPVSIDTSKATVAQSALAAGATMINDVGGLAGPGMAKVVAEAGCPVVIMRHADCHDDVLGACQAQLQALTQQAIGQGVQPGQIIVDPGLGFGRRPGAHVEDNLALIDGLATLSYPVLIGASRKRFVGTMADDADPAGERRINKSVELAVRAARRGAAMVRVHDVGPTVAALQVAGFR